MPRGLVVLTPPAGEPVSLTEAKQWLRVDVGDDDALILRVLRGAREQLEAEYNRVFVSTRLRQTHDRFPRYSSSAVWQYNSDAIWQQRLPVTQLSGQWYPDRASIRVTRPPMQQLNSITYQDGSGVNQMLVNLLPAGVPGVGSQVVTPATMFGVTVGLQVLVDLGTAQETVTVTAVTATTFTAAFTNTHPVNTVLSVVPASSNPPAVGAGLVDVDYSTEPARVAPAYGQIWPIVRQKVATLNVDFWAGYGPVTTVTAAALAGSQTVTPASMNGIFLGGLLVAEPGMLSEETVTVSAVTATTFTATFAQAHAANWSIGPALPHQAKDAILLLAAHRYENREAVAQGSYVEMPRGVESIMRSIWPGEYE